MLTPQLVVVHVHRVLDETPRRLHEWETRESVRQVFPELVIRLRLPRDRHGLGERADGIAVHPHRASRAHARSVRAPTTRRLHIPAQRNHLRGVPRLLTLLRTEVPRRPIRVERPPALFPAAHLCERVDPVDDVHRARRFLLIPEDASQRALHVLLDHLLVLGLPHYLSRPSCANAATMASA
ncbi:hypothetical protein PIS_050 [Saccharomonospora phage PIS 136]|nr:hypothetical protein PIS_050 [Saccharomonospora phage PIS 136]